MVPENDLPKLFAWARTKRLALFPIPKFCKRPTGIVRSHATDWSFDEQQWAKWWVENNGCNFGVACGPSKIIVADVDTLRGQPYDDAFASWARGDGAPVFLGATVRTPTNGHHYYFRVVGETETDRMRQPDIAKGQVNTRAGRGYVVAPWSVTDPAYDPGVKAKGAYAILDDAIPLAPAKLLAHCAPDATGPGILPASNSAVELDPNGYPSDDATRWTVVSRVEEIRKRLKRAAHGERNSELNIAAFALGKLVAEGTLGPHVAEMILLEDGISIGLPLEEIRATGRSGLRSAPLVGRPDPKTALGDLLNCQNFIAWDIPLATMPRPVKQRSKSDLPDIPVVSFLLYEGDVTLLSGGASTGKTTFAASLAAASTTDVRHFNFGSFEEGLSDVYCRTGVWIFVSYEGAQYIERNLSAWYKGMGVQPSHPARFVLMSMDEGPLVGVKDRKAFAEQTQAARINAEITQARANWPGLPIVVVVDNVTSAVENPIEPEQAGIFMRTMKAIARQDVAVLVLGHPTKNGSSPIYGSHILSSLADIVGTLEVVRRDKGEWTQWIEFGAKHRAGLTHRTLEVRSRRLNEPLIELPKDYMEDHPLARARVIEDLHLPYVRTIREKRQTDKEAVKSGVIESVSPKAEATMSLTG